MISSQVGITMDLTATILAAAGAQLPAAYRPEGIDLLPPLQKGTVIDRTLFWRTTRQKAVRRGQWKYLDDGSNATSGFEFLFDLRSDRGERHDLASSNPKLVAELRGLVEKWEADVNAEAKLLPTPPKTPE